MLTSDMRAVVQAAHLGFAATVTPDGKPNLSPKGTVRVWDDKHLFFLDIASPGTRENLAHSPWMEINVVEQLSRRGYRFAGRASWHAPGDAIYDDGVRRIYDTTLPAEPPPGVVLLDVDHAAPLLSPAYWRGLDETALRAQWRERRAALDREFDAYLETVAPVRVDLAAQTLTSTKVTAPAS